MKKMCHILAAENLHRFFLIKNGALFLTLLVSLGVAGCSDDNDDNGIGGSNGKAPTTCTLDANNANMPCAGTIWVYHTDAPAGSGIGQLVDDNADTKYVTYRNSVNITWNGDNRTTIVTYSLTSAADTPEADPQAWTLSGSLDNQKWVVLDKQESQTFTERKQTKTYTIVNKDEYKYYRLAVLSNHGADAIQLAEFALSADEFVGDIDDLLSKSMGTTASPTCKMGIQHEDSDQPTTADKLVWLKDPKQEPDTWDGLGWADFTVPNLFPFGKPYPADVNQKAIGDCCLCAALACFAYVYPDFIKEIVKDNGDGTFTVKLHNPEGEQIEIGVSSRFVGNPGSLGACSGYDGQPSWATVVEKAIIKWFQAFRGTPNIGGIGTEYVGSILSGDGASIGFHAGRLTPEELQRAVIVSLKRGDLVAGGFSQGGVKINDKGHTTVSGHAFTMSLPNDDSMMFCMRNPWGDHNDDHVMPIYNDGTVPQLIDLRIMSPGAAAKYGIGGQLSPYVPPFLPTASMFTSH